MKLLELNPFDVHFGDLGYEEETWKVFNNIEPLLKEDIHNKGILNPIIVYEVGLDPHLTGLLQKTVNKEHPIEGYWCWRGSQRLRIARQEKYPIIKALLLDKEKPDIKEVQKYFVSPVEVFFHRYLERWDVK